MSRPRKMSFGLLGAGMAGLLLILLLGPIPAAAEEMDIDGIRVNSGDPLDTLDFDDPTDIHDDIQDGGVEPPSLTDESILIIVPGFKNRHFLIIVEIHNGLPRIRFEEVQNGKRRVED